jgi:hypothetical protein
LASSCIIPKIYYNSCLGSARETKWPALITILCDNLYTIGNHVDRPALGIFEFRCRLIARECIVVTWQVDDSRPTRVVAVEEGWTLVESFTGERAAGGITGMRVRPALSDWVCDQGLKDVGEVV